MAAAGAFSTVEIAGCAVLVGLAIIGLDWLRRTFEQIVEEETWLDSQRQAERALRDGEDPLQHKRGK